VAIQFVKTEGFCITICRTLKSFSITDMLTSLH